MFPRPAIEIFLDWEKAIQRAEIPSGEAWELAPRLPPLDKSLTNSCLEDPGKWPHFPAEGSQNHFKVSSKSQLLLLSLCFVNCSGNFPGEGRKPWTSRGLTLSVCDGLLRAGPHVAAPSSLATSSPVTTREAEVGSQLGLGTTNLGAGCPASSHLKSNLEKVAF